MTVMVSSGEPAEPTRVVLSLRFAHPPAAVDQDELGAGLREEAVELFERGLSPDELGCLGCFLSRLL
jgi:hypothetical protein